MVEVKTINKKKVFKLTVSLGSNPYLLIIVIGIVYLGIFFNELSQGGMILEEYPGGRGKNGNNKFIYHC